MCVVVRHPLKSSSLFFFFLIIIIVSDDVSGEFRAENELQRLQCRGPSSRGRCGVRTGEPCCREEDCNADELAVCVCVCAWPICPLTNQGAELSCQSSFISLAPLLPVSGRKTTV